MNFDPRDYQDYAYRFLMRRLYVEDHPGAGLLLDPGLGKTLVTLWLAETMRDLAGLRRVLVVAPVRVCYSTWPGEIAKWQSTLNYRIVHGSPKKRRQALEDPNAELLCVNPEGLPWLAKQNDLPDFDLVVFDESTKFKNFTAKRSKAAHKIVQRVPKRIILTGTPSPNSYADLFGQIYLLDEGAALGQTLSFFRAHYMKKGGFQGRVWQFNDHRRSSLEDAIAPMVLRLEAADHLDLPDLVDDHIVWVDLPDETMRAYKKFERDLFLALEEDKSLTATSAGAAYASCRGIANGGVYLPNDLTGEREIAHVHDAKTEALCDLVDELGGKPVLVAYQFKHDLERLKKVYPKAPVISGSQKPSEVEQVIQDWNDRKVHVLLAQPQAMSHGLNMQAGGNDIVWFGLDNQLEIYQQLNARLYRQGVVGQVRLHHLLARGTVDEAMWVRLSDKAEGQRSLMETLKRYEHGELALAA